MSALPDFQQTTVVRAGGTVVIIGIDVDLTQSMIDPTRALAVHADTIRLPHGGSLVLPGRAVTLVARVLQANGATIDTSGPPPSITYSPGDMPGPGGATGGFGAGAGGVGGTGTGGQAGAPASGGRDGGPICVAATSLLGALTLIADGGSGGRGQDGSRGGQGGHGLDGADAQLDFTHMLNPVAAMAGMAGGPGGPGGAAGASGGGGHAGRILVATTTPAANVTMHSSGGSAGAQATPGAGGTGGDGGLGGHKVIHQTFTWQLSSARTSSGATGGAGPAGHAPLPARAGVGHAGLLDQVALLDSTAFVTRLPASLEAAQLAMHAADLGYMERDYASALARYDWLAAIVPEDVKAIRSQAPMPWTKINATCAWPDGHTHFFFRDGHCYRHDPALRRFDAGPVDLQTFTGMGGLGPYILAALDQTHIDGQVYFFLTDGTCVAYDVAADRSNGSRIYPTSLWPGIETFSKDIVGAFSDRERSYFLTSKGQLHSFRDCDRGDRHGPGSFDDLHPGLAPHAGHVLSVLDWSRVDGSLYVFLDDGRSVRVRPDKATPPDVFPASWWEAGATSDDATRWVAIGQRARTLGAQIRQGQDFFGEYCNHVPVVDLKTYQAALGALLSLAGDVEVQAGIYEDRSRSLAQRRAAVAASQTHLQTAIGHLQTASADRLAEEKALTGEIAAMAVAEADIARALGLSQAAFRTAVANQLPNCTFDDILSCVQAVVAIVAGAETGIGEIEGVVALEGEAAKFTNYIAKLSKIAKTAQDIQKNFNAVRSTITKSMPDAAKIPIAEDDFDKAMQPFLALPQAQAYQTLMHTYVAQTQARNAKVVKLNQTHFRLRTTEAEAAEKTAALAQVQAHWSSDADPDLPHNRAMMTGLARGLRARVLTLLYEENQAYRYWSLKPSPLVANDATVANLAAAHATLSADILTDMGSTLQPPQRFTGHAIRFDPTSHPEAFAVFVSTGRLHFAIAADDPYFAGLTQAVVTRYAVALPGVVPATSPASRVYATLTQGGRSTFIDSAGTSHTFSHNRRSAEYFYFTDASNRPGGGDLGGAGGDYIAVSPFGAWTLELPAAFNPGLDLSGVSAVDLTLTGGFR